MIMETEFFFIILFYNYFFLKRVSRALVQNLGFCNLGFFVIFSPFFNCPTFDDMSEKGLCYMKCRYVRRSTIHS